MTIQKLLKGRALPLLFGMAVIQSAAFAADGDITSVYTDINFDDCIMLEEYELGVDFACPGYKGFPMFVAEGDLRMFVSYGFGAPDEVAAHQTLPAFNTIHTKLEWRLKQQGGLNLPFATILRFFTDSGQPDIPKGEILIVTKIEAGNTCHVAYIDAKLTKNANEVARQFADIEAPGFDCEKDEILVVPD